MISPESIALDKSTLALKVGDTVTLISTVTPDDATDKTVTYASSDSEIATVTPKQGKVTAIAIGSATITGTTVNDKTATCEVTITQ